MNKKNNPVSKSFGSNFLVTIYHQENYSWQGAVEWLDTGKKMHFRSELELINLINSAVSEQANDSKPMRTWHDERVINAI